jgi:hypothetical protein
MDGANGVMVKRTGGQMDRWTVGQENMLRSEKVER